jgi:hypothetical protein
VSASAATLSRHWELFDAAAGQAKDFVLRHRKHQCNLTRQPGIKTPQNARDDPVRHDHKAMHPAAFAEPFCEAGDQSVMALAIRSAEIPFVSTIPVEHSRRAHCDFLIGQPIPGAERQFPQAIVNSQFRIGCQILPDDLAGVPCSAQWAGDDTRGFDVRQNLKKSADGMRLRDASFGQRRIRAALVTPLQIPFGFAMADEQDRPGHVMPTPGAAVGRGRGASAILQERGDDQNHPPARVSFPGAP